MFSVYVAWWCLGEGTDIMTSVYAEWLSVVHFCNSWWTWLILAGGGGGGSPPDPLPRSPLRSSNALPPPPHHICATK